MAEHAPAAEKVAAVAEITAEFRDASAMVVTEYRGLTMKQITQLRRSLGNDVTFIPGHGPTSTFGRERQTNAFVSDYALS